MISPEVEKELQGHPLTISEVIDALLEIRDREGELPVYIPMPFLTSDQIRFFVREANPQRPKRVEIIHG